MKASALAATDAACYLSGPSAAAKELAVKPINPFSRISMGLWFVPLMCVLAGVGLSMGTIAIDRAYDYELIPQSISGGPDAALEILGTVAASMVSLAALVLTVTMVVVQLAMGQFSPRIVQHILQDKPSQLAIGVFVGTFAHAMLALREVETEGDGVVPGLAVVIAFALVIISIAVLVWYVNHIGRQLRVSALIELVGADTRKLLNRFYTDSGATPRFEKPTIPSSRSGVVVQIDHQALVRIAEAGDCVLELKPALGEFVPAGAALFEIEGAAERIDADAASRGIKLGLERTLDQDVAYGLRMLVDVAERSLSDSPFLDPTTAVQAIDRLHDCLRQLALSQFPDGQHRDKKDVVRLITRSTTWDDYVHLAFDEIRLAGAGSPQIARRLSAALQDLLTIAPPERQEVLKEQLALLQSGIDSSVSEPSDRTYFKSGDPLGLA